MGGIIVARHEMSVIELAPVKINYGLTVEEMIAGFAGNSPDITSEHFPNCRAGRTGEAELFFSICLVKPVPTRQHLSDAEVEKRVEAAGFVFEELPALAPFKEEGNASELWNAGVGHILVLGANSRWRNADGVYVVGLRLRASVRGFSAYRLEDNLRSEDWVVCRKLPSAT